MRRQWILRVKMRNSAKFGLVTDFSAFFVFAFVEFN